ncbi:aminoacyl--tRNA ligase-related protein [Candidatus Hepatobacter penaei]|uniref:aminoacyl--tRNA ligase-related protein n=1 Tax=Candidatus Hepatobacter penaei TaxID=1274402 RepID=UPI0004F27F44|nr:aminoacyl--tRNA ligase-related protein [Candidatus Hepatobacter penaei]
MFNFIIGKKVVVRLTNYFWHTCDDPSLTGETSYAWMRRLSMIHPLSTGIYAWSPMGLKALKKVSTLVREAQEAIGGLEVMMTMVQPLRLWQASGRAISYGPELVTWMDRKGEGCVCSPISEEALTDFFKAHIQRASQLPQYFFQLQWKFADRETPGPGMLRSRDFITADGCSFDADEKGMHQSRRRVVGSYANVFQRMGASAVLVPDPENPRAHQVVLLTPEGSLDVVYEDEAMHDALRQGTLYEAQVADASTHTSSSSRTFVRGRGVQVGHITLWGTSISNALGACVDHDDKASLPVFMGSYAINLSALLAGLIGLFHDARGIVWPDCFAPFALSLMVMDENLRVPSDAVYAHLRKAGVDVLYDDRAVEPLVKKKDMDLLGLPYQAVVTSQQQVCVTNRATGEEVTLAESAFVSHAQAGTWSQVFGSNLSPRQQSLR